MSRRRPSDSFAWRSYATIPLMPSNPYSPRTWLKAHPIKSAAIILIVGWVLGWVVGSRAACGPGWASCTFDAALFGAVGTWLGAAGAIGAVVYAAAQLRNEIHKQVEAQQEREQKQQDRDEQRENIREAREQRREAREVEQQRILLEQTSALSTARRCVLRTTPKNLENTAHTSVTISFTNKTSEDVTDAVIFLDDEEIHRADLVAPGMTWGKTYPRDRLGLEQLPKEPAPAAGEVLNRQLRPRLTFEFSIGIRRYQRVLSDVVEIPWSTPWLEAEQRNEGQDGATAQQPLEDTHGPHFRTPAARESVKTPAPSIPQ